MIVGNLYQVLRDHSNRGASGGSTRVDAQPWDAP